MRRCRSFAGANLSLGIVSPGYLTRFNNIAGESNGPLLCSRQDMVTSIWIFLVNVVREVWKSQASAAEAECTLLKQLWHLKGRNCGDPRDKAFAILDICKDLKSGDVAVDYSASVARVYSEVSKFIVLRDRSLKLLSACQSYGSDITDLPSWAPDWSIYEIWCACCWGRKCRSFCEQSVTGMCSLANAIVTVLWKGSCERVG